MNEITKATHTPGPWELRQEISYGTLGRILIRKEGAGAICIIPCRDNVDPEGTLATQKANAALIAAAPDLLAALELCLPWMAKAVESGAFKGCAIPRGGEVALAQMEAAIAKAKGEQS